MGSALAEIRRILACCLTMALVFSLVLTPCAHADFTLNDEIELGNKFNVLIRSQLSLIQDPEVIDYMSYILDRFTRTMPQQPVPFQLNVIHDNSLNAFAVPGGYIFVHSGLILAMPTEAELAGVIAHEMAHVSQRHIARRMEKAKYSSLLALAGMLAGALAGGSEAGMGIAMGGVAASQAAMLSYSRSDEAEADQVGMNYYLASGYPPEAMVEAFRLIQRPQWVSGAEIPTYLSTHPAIPERVSDLSVRIQNMAVPQKNRRQVDNSQFLRIQTLLRGRYANPEDAEKFFNEQLAGKEQALAWLGMGLLNERRNKIAAASEAFDKAIALNPDDQIFLRELGRFNYLKGDKQKAVRFLQQATAQNPRDYLAIFYYARLLEDSGHREQAIPYYAQVLRLQPEDPEAHDYYARALGHENKLFPAYLHLAYSALYANSQERVEQLLIKVKELAKNQAEQTELESLERKYAERKVFWK